MPPMATSVGVGLWILARSSALAKAKIEYSSQLSVPWLEPTVRCQRTRLAKREIVSRRDKTKIAEG